MPRWLQVWGLSQGCHRKGEGGFWRSGILLQALSGGKHSWCEGPEVLLCWRGLCKGREMSFKDILLYMIEFQTNSIDD